MQTQIQESDDSIKVSILKKKEEEEKMRNVLLLLESLSYREETSIKLIIDCLYDVGYINLIDKKFRSRTLNGSLKWIAKLSKPAFRIIAWRWYKKNCPRLVANWLRKKVSFEPKVKKVKQEAVLIPEAQPIVADSLAKLETKNLEVQHLRSQVKMLASLLIGLVVVFGGSVIWFGYSLERYNIQTIEKLQNRIRYVESGTDEPFATGE